MKLLILGLDGGDLDIISAMDMPFLQSLIRERTSVSVKTDLYSRGWSEILTGLHGSETGAFYEKPLLDGTVGFSQNFNIDDYYRVPGCIPLWDKLAQNGLKIGFMNIPTTLPAPQVPGFFISGAGAGYSPESRVPEIACHPPELSYELLKMEFNWEQRFRASGIQNFDFFIDNCTQAVNKRTRAFESLARKYKVDVGFIVHKEFTVLANLFMHKLEPIINNPKHSPDPAQRRIISFFRMLDDFLKITVTEIQPRHVMIVSDHSARPYRHSLNVNHFLAEHGFLTSFSKTSIKKKIITEIRHVKKTIVPRIGKALGLIESRFSNPFYDTWPDMGTIDYEKTIAFGNRYVPGIYLNDERFLNCVSENSKKSLVKKIISEFNLTPEARSYNLSAKSYREVFKDSFSEKHLPDIWIDMPDTMFPEQKGTFVQNNPYWKNFNDLTFAVKDIMTGKKGDAICIAENEYTSGLNGTGLTKAYHLILRHVGCSDE